MTVLVASAFIGRLFTALLLCMSTTTTFRPNAAAQKSCHFIKPVSPVNGLSSAISSGILDADVLVGPEKQISLQNISLQGLPDSIVRLLNLKAWALIP